MKTITYQQIKSHIPNNNLNKIGMAENYEATVVDFIDDYRSKFKKKSDILSVLLRNDFMSDVELRLFAVWCARQIQHLITDESFINTINVAERYANREATFVELACSRSYPISSNNSKTDYAHESALHTSNADAQFAAWYAALSAAWANASGSTQYTVMADSRNAQIDHLREIFLNQ